MSNEAKFYSGIDLNDTSLLRPEIKDYAETVNALGNATGAITIDLTLGNIVTATTTGTTTWTLSNPPASGKAGMFTLILTNGGSSSQVWPSPNTKWIGGSAPTLTTSGKDIITFMTIDGGTTWNAIVAGLDIK